MPTPQEDYCIIPLSKGKTAIVDAKDFNWLSEWKWYAVSFRTSKGFYAIRTGLVGDGYSHLKSIMMHRVILGSDSRNADIVDHVNGNSLDNRRCNLRLCSKSQNGANSKVRSNNKCGLKGVSWFAPKQKYRATIHVMRKSIHLGYFHDPVEAHIAYSNAAKRYFGEFARF